MGTKWLRDLDKNKDGGEGWYSDRYDAKDRDAEVVGLYNNKSGTWFTWGEACHALNKCWDGYRASRRYRMNDTNMAYKINKFQYYMGIQLTEWDFFDMDQIRHQLEMEEELGEQGEEDN